MKLVELRLILILWFLEIISALKFLIVGTGKLAGGFSWLKANTIQCYLYSSLFNWIGRAEMVVVAILAMLRYLIVCHKIEKSFTFWLIALVISCIPCTTIYTYGAIMRDATPSNTYLYCSPFSQPSPITNVINIIVPFLLLIPCWVSTLCYFLVGHNVNKQLSQMKKEAETNGDANFILIIKKQKIKLIIQLVLVFIFYNGNFMISYITLIMKFLTGFKRPPTVDALSFALVNFTIALNPIITIVFQPELNNEFKVFLVKLQAKCANLFRNLFNIQ